MNYKLLQDIKFWSKDNKLLLSKLYTLTNTKDIKSLNIVKHTILYYIRTNANNFDFVFVKSNLFNLLKDIDKKINLVEEKSLPKKAIHIVNKSQKVASNPKVLKVDDPEKIIQ